MAPRERTPHGIKWHDLTQLTARRKLTELVLPLPWLAVSWALYASPFWVLGALGSFMFFLCALRLNHEAIHGNLGLSPRGNTSVMFVLSALMMGSNHAVAFCHLQHHRAAMGPDDHEGRCGHMSAWQVLKYGPRFPVDLNMAVWAAGSRRWRRLMVLDWVFILATVAGVIWLGWTALYLHVAAMITAQCLTAFFAVWITHQGTLASGLAGRSQRGLLARLAYLMFYHREHHLFPNVPVSRLPDLAARLDTEVPGYAAARKPVVSFLDRPVTRARS